MSGKDRSARPSWHDRGFGRRGSSPGPPPSRPARRAAGRPAAAQAATSSDGLHGVELRGMYLTSKDRLAEGRFGHDVQEAARVRAARRPADEPGADDGRADATSATRSPQHQPGLFAGFTFIGQFIDHDITFDNTPLDQQLADPDARVNFRTPRYDLDSVYGARAGVEPQFYDPADRDKLLVTPNVNGVEDMPRDGRRAGRSSRNPATTRT